AIDFVELELVVMIVESNPFPRKLGPHPIEDRDCRVVVGCGQVAPLEKTGVTDIPGAGDLQRADRLLSVCRAGEAEVDAAMPHPVSTAKFHEQRSVRRERLDI